MNHAINGSTAIFGPPSAPEGRVSKDGGKSISAAYGRVVEQFTTLAWLYFFRDPLKA